MRFLIIENLDGEIYTYFESYEHHTLLLTNGERNIHNRVSATELDNECVARKALRHGEWIAVPVL